MGPRTALLIAGLFVAPSAGAEECKVVELDFTPAEIALPGAAMRAPSQIVAWLEDASGVYVDTIFITQAVGTFGLANRPGRWDFDSGPAWPYGRRITVFPIWAHRRAASGAPIWPELVFQNDDESNLSHPLAQSSQDFRYCRPMQKTEPAWDAGTCPSAVSGTDKGELHASKTNLYPPRDDLGARLPGDTADVLMFDMLNPFDAVSAPTPVSGVPAFVSAVIPSIVQNGNYTLWVEVSREFDHNTTYSTARYPSPVVSFGDYGEPYRGQPSILYKVPFTIGALLSVASTLDYAGYGDPDGLDGNVRPPDDTISTGVPGSGAERFAVRADGGTPYRVRVTSRVEIDDVPPAAPTNVAVNTLAPTSATIELVSPGDDGLVGRVAAYDVRYVAGPSLDEASFEQAIELHPDLAIAPAGTTVEFTITNLLYDTEYTVGIRARDNCTNVGALATVTFRTPPRGQGEVDACFVATAAYGSALANDVDSLRTFRDRVLRSTVLGELATEAYYTFGPALSGAIGESDVLRASARAILDPIVKWARAFRF